MCGSPFVVYKNGICPVATSVISFGSFFSRCPTWCLPIGGDGAADGADTDCADDAACAGAENEVCGNGANDDGDGIADRASPDCAAAQICSNVGLSGAGCLLSPGASEAGKVSATLLFSLLLAGLALLRKRPDLGKIRLLHGMVF
jgi:hypothetical protein